MLHLWRIPRCLSQTEWFLIEYSRVHRSFLAELLMNHQPHKLGPPLKSNSKCMVSFADPVPFRLIRSDNSDWQGFFLEYLTAVLVVVLTLLLFESSVRTLEKALSAPSDHSAKSSSKSTSQSFLSKGDYPRLLSEHQNLFRSYKNVRSWYHLGEY